MRFLAPGMALLALAVIPPVVALYFLKLKRKEAVVPSTFLWRQAVRDLRVNAPFQRLKRSLLLLLQLLVLAAALLALARPVLRWQGVEGMNHVLLVDVSASMGATDVAPSRLEAAKAEARRVVDGLARGDRVMVVAFAEKAHVACPLTADKAEIRGAIDALAVRETRTQVEEALRIALAIADRNPPAAVTLLSDGAFEPVAGLPSHRAPIRFVPVGSPDARNAGVVALEARRPYAASPDFQVFAAVRNAGKIRETRTLEIWHGETLVDARPLALEPGAEQAVVYDRPGLVDGWIRVALDGGDALAADDQAWAVLAAERKPRVLLVARENWFLERALRVVPTRSIVPMDPGAFEAGVAAKTIAWDGFDLVVVDGAAPAALPPEAPNLLWFDGAPPLEGFAARGRVQRPPVLDWNRAHPVMRAVGFGNVGVTEAARLEVPKWAETLVESGGDGPLAAAAETARRRVVVVAFSPLQSDWPLRISFPLFIANAVAWLGAGPGGSSAGAPTALAAGDVLAVPAGPDATAVEVTPPGRPAVRLPLDASHRAAFADTARAGLYRVRDDRGAESAVAVNLLSRLESDLAPRTTLDLGGEKPEAVGSAVASTREIWRWLVFAALAALAVEWIVYTRGIAR
jgi:hypothetical protein